MFLNILRISTSNVLKTFSFSDWVHTYTILFSLKFTQTNPKWKINNNNNNLFSPLLTCDSFYNFIRLLQALRNIASYLNSYLDVQVNVTS